MAHPHLQLDGSCFERIASRSQISEGYSAAALRSRESLRCRLLGSKGSGSVHSAQWQCSSIGCSDVRCAAQGCRGGERSHSSLGGRGGRQADRGSGCSSGRGVAINV